MNKKLIFIIIIILVIVTVGVFYFLNKPQQGLQPSITDKSVNGILINKEWTKSFESYCAQGSDYFTLKTINNEELVLEFEPVYTETQMSNFSGKNVTVTGEKKSKKIKCPEGSQCPVTPDGVFTCEVFKINKIGESKPTNNSVLDPSGKVTNNNLKTYRNEQFGFEFSYPEKLKLITRNRSRDSKEIYLIDDPIGHPDDWYFENNIPDYSNPYLDKAIWLSVYPDQPTVEQFISWRFGKPNWKFTTETISGISALLSTHVVVDFSSGPKDQAMIIFDKNNTAYMWLTTDTQGKSNNADLLNQIVSSFKFIK